MGAVVKNTGNSGTVRGKHVDITVADIPGACVRQKIEPLQNPTDHLRIWLVFGDVVGADSGLKQILPTPLINRFQFLVEKLTVSVRSHCQPNTHGPKRAEVFIRTRLKWPNLSEVTPVRLIVSLVGNQSGLFVVAKNRTEYVGSRDPAFCENARVQAPKNADVANQPGIVFRATLLFRQQLIHQPELFQLRQHIFHGAEHGVVGIYQGSVPIKYQHRRS